MLNSMLNYDPWYLLRVPPCTNQQPPGEAASTEAVAEAVDRSRSRSVVRARRPSAPQNTVRLDRTPELQINDPCDRSPCFAILCRRRGHNRHMFAATGKQPGASSTASLVAAVRQRKERKDERSILAAIDACAPPCLLEPTRRSHPGGLGLGRLTRTRASRAPSALQESHAGGLGLGLGAASAMDGSTAPSTIGG